MNVLKGHWDENHTIVLDSNEEIERDTAICIEDVRNDHNLVYLFYPSDIPNVGNPIEPKVKRMNYLQNPTCYGVACYYQDWSGKVIFE